MTTPSTAPRLERSIELDADAGEVWEAITQPDQLQGWLGDEVEIDMQPGGCGHVVDDDGVHREVLVTAVEPGRRLAWHWWADGGELSSVEITLVANAVIIGKVVDAAGAPVGGIGVAVVPETGDGHVQLSMEGPPPTSGPDGTFRLETKAGKVTLLLLTPPRPTMKRGIVLDAGKTFDAGAITIGQPAPPPKP